MNRISFKSPSPFVRCACIFLSANIYAAQSFHWNWRQSQELNAEQSLHNVKVKERDRHAIAAAVADQLRPSMSDLEIESEDQLQEAALKTRVKMIDLNHDRIPEVVAQGMVDCSATGNCPFWIFQKQRRGYKLLLEGKGQTFTIQETTTNGFSDVVVSVQFSAFEKTLIYYRYESGSYHIKGCYIAAWREPEGGTKHEPKTPRISPTPCNNQ